MLDSYPAVKTWLTWLQDLNLPEIEPSLPWLPCSGEEGGGGEAWVWRKDRSSSSSNLLTRVKPTIHETGSETAPQWTEGDLIRSWKKTHHLTDVFWSLILYWHWAKCQRSRPSLSLTSPTPLSFFFFKQAQWHSDLGAKQKQQGF